MKKYIILLSLLFIFLLGNAQNKYLLKVGTSGYTTAQIDSLNALNLKQLDTAYTGSSKVLTQWKAGQLYVTQTALNSKLNISDTAGMILPYRNAINNNTNSIANNLVLISTKTDTTRFKADSAAKANTIATNTANIATNTISIAAKVDTGSIYLKTTTLNNTGILHNTPTYSYNSATHDYSITQTLATQSANKVFGTGISSSTPLFRNVDSVMFGGNFQTQVRAAQAQASIDTTTRFGGIKTIYNAYLDSSLLRGLVNTSTTNIATNATNISNEITRATAAELLKLNISDSLIKYVTPKNLKDSGTVYRGLISGKIDSIRLANTGILHTTPATFSLSGTTGVITQTLATQAASVVLRTGSVIGQPSFGKIDSTHAPDIHSQNYYDGRYGTVTQQNINAANITTNTNAITTKLNISDTAAMLSAKQPTLVSSTNIKTVNGNTLLGSGDLIIVGGVTSVNTRTGAVVINSGDITTGLGYSPLDSLGSTYLKTVTLSNTGVIHNTPTYTYNPITKNYTITQTLANQTANTFLSGNATGAAATTPTFRAIVPLDVPTLNQNTTGNAATVTTNANLTGDMTSVGNATTASGAIVKTVVLNTPSVIYANPITFNTSGSTATGSLVLNTQVPHSLFGTTTATATPTFIQSIDSTYIPGFHTTSYYDNRYALAASLANYLPLNGGTLTGTLNGTTANFVGEVASSSSTNKFRMIASSNGNYYFGSNTSGLLDIQTNSTSHILLDGTTKATTFAGSVTASSFIKLGANALQFQMGDGTSATVDGTTIVNTNGVLSSIGSGLRKVYSGYGLLNVTDSMLKADTSIIATKTFASNPANIIQTSSYRFSTDAEKANYANGWDSTRSKNDSIAKNTAFNNLVEYNGISLTSTWNGEGHSIAAGSSATSTANRFYNLLAAATSTTLNNTAVGGSTVRNVIYRRFSYAETYNTTQSLACYIGINDIGNSLSATSPYSIYKGLQTVVANQYLDTVFRVDASPVTTSGTWATLTTANISSKSTIKGFGNPIYSATAGSTLSFPFIGNNLVIGYWGVDITHTTFGRFSVTVDGNNYGTYDTKGGAIDYYYASIGTFDFRMPNVAVVKIPDGKHSIVITVLDNLEVDFDYIGRMGQPQFQKGVIVGKLGYCLQAGYSLYPAGYIRNNKVDSANRYIDSLKTIFNSLGYPLVIVNPNSYVDTTTAFVGSDGLHPSNGGHYSIYQSFFQGIKQTGSSGSFINNSTSSQTGNFNISGIGKQNGLVVGNEFGNYVTAGNHKSQINANYNQTALFLSGGTGAELWDSTALTNGYKVYAGHTDSSIHFQVYNAIGGAGFADFLKANTVTKNITFPATATFNSTAIFNGITSSGQTLINTSNTDYTNSGGAGASFLINNSSASGQNVIMGIINGAVKSKWRTDAAGNINWVSYNSGNHFFFNGGDYATGSVSAVIGRNGTTGWMQVGYNNPSPTFSYNLDVNGTAYVNGTFLTKKVTVTTGSNASVGTATLVAGTITVSTTAVTANSLIFVGYQGAPTTVTSVLTVPTITAGASFVITALTAGGTATAITDNNLVKWWIIN